MPRYIKQKDNYSCAAIAVFNALKWQGKNITYKHFSKIKKELKTTKSGTPLVDIASYFIKKFNKQTKIILIKQFNSKNDKLATKILYQYLSLPYLFYLSTYFPTEKSAHAFLIYKKDNQFKAINLYKGNIEQIISRQRVISLLQNANLVIQILKG